MLRMRRRLRLKLRISRNGRVLEDDLVRRIVVRTTSGMRNRKIVQLSPNVFGLSAKRSIGYNAMVANFGSICIALDFVRIKSKKTRTSIAKIANLRKNQRPNDG